MNSRYVANKLHQLAHFLESESCRAIAINDDERGWEMQKDAEEAREMANYLWENGFPK